MWMHNAHTVDHNILESITCKDTFTISFKRSMKVATMNEKYMDNVQG